jgi:hypothetical protein
MTLCDICGLPVIDLDGAHQPHDVGCSRFDCWCDDIVHPWCCPDCRAVDQPTVDLGGGMVVPLRELLEDDPS